MQPHVWILVVGLAVLGVVQALLHLSTLRKRGEGRRAERFVGLTVNK